MAPTRKNPYEKSVNQKYKIRDHNLGHEKNHKQLLYEKLLYEKSVGWVGRRLVAGPVLSSPRPRRGQGLGGLLGRRPGVTLGLAVCRAGGRAARASAGPACRGGVGSALPAGGLARRPRPHPKKP